MTHSKVLVAGVAGLVAGAMSMTAGAHVSVHSQAETEQADIECDRKEINRDYLGESQELAAIYGSAASFRGTTTRRIVDGVATFEDLSWPLSEVVTFDVSASGLTGLSAETLTVDPVPYSTQLWW